MTSTEVVGVEQQIHEHKALFLRKVNEQIADKDAIVSLLTMEEFNCIKFVIEKEKSGLLTTMEKSKLSKQKAYINIYRWLKKYDVITISDSSVLVYKEETKGDGTLPSLDEYKRVSNINTVFEDISGEHRGDHPKGK